MGLNYKPLLKLLIDRNLKKKDLMRLANISGPTMARIGKNQYISLEALEKICLVLDCQLSDIVEITDEKNK